MAEYLVLDPTGQFAPEWGRGWRLVEGVYQPWAVDERGRGVSQQFVGAAIGIEDGLAAVYGADGRRHPREGEVGVTLLTERLEGRAEGLHEGRREGKRAMLQQMVRQRFGVVAALEATLDRLLAAAEPADLR